MAEQGTYAADLPHQGHPGGGSDKEQAAPTSTGAYTLRFGVGALVGILVNLNPPESPLPMAIAIASCGFGSALCYWLLTGKQR